MLAPNRNRNITERLQRRKNQKTTEIKTTMKKVISCRVNGRTHFYYAHVVVVLYSNSISIYLCIGVYSFDRLYTHSHIIYLTICYKFSIIVSPSFQIDVHDVCWLFWFCCFDLCWVKNDINQIKDEKWQNNWLFVRNRQMITNHSRQSMKHLDDLCRFFINENDGLLDQILNYFPFEITKHLH